MARPSELERRGEDFQNQIAELYVAGKTRAEIADALTLDMEDAVPPDVKTITRWVRDPRVQAKITALTRERANRFISKIDAIIEGRLEHPEKLETKELLEIRKTIAPQRVEVGGIGSSDQADAAAFDAFDEDPEYDADGSAEEEPPRGLPPAER
jgi:hypothetical protein